MPTYEFKCEKCNKKYSLMLSISEYGFQISVGSALVYVNVRWLVSMRKESAEKGDFVLFC